MTEAELQAAVIDLAHVYGWKVAHFRPAKTDKGWRTPVGADGKGFVDLVLAAPIRPDAITAEVLFVELKSATGKVSPEQHEWLERLYPNACVWRPKDWPEPIHSVLSGSPPPSPGEMK
jgi:hypothetical protein